MTSLMLDDINQFRDNLGVWIYHTAVDEFGLPPAEAVVLAARLSRDQCRAPNQWANAPNGGFSPAGVQPWLPVNPNYAQGVNVTDQLADPDSMLNFYHRMLRMRKQTPALVAGDYTPLHEDAEDYLAFLRRSQADGQTCLVFLNMSDQARTLSFDLDAHLACFVFSSHVRDGDTDDLSRLTIAPFEIYIAEIA